MDRRKRRKGSPEPQIESREHTEKEPRILRIYTNFKDLIMDKVVYANEAYLIQGVLFDVYNTLGAGFLEAVYQEALELELKQRNIPFVSQKELKIVYKGKTLKQTYRADIVCYDKIILELKAVKTLLPEHSAQLHNYLRATGMKLGILVNFGSSSQIEIKRIVV